MKRLITGTLTILLATATMSGCANKEADDAATSSSSVTATTAPPLPADVQQVSAAMSQTTATDGAAATATAVDANTLVATGEFVTPIRSELAPKIGGRVAKVYVDDGSVVRRGQPLFELESDYARLNVQAAQAGVASAKAALDEAGRDLQRKKELVAKDSIPRATFDRSQATFDQAQAAYALASAQLALMRQQLSDSTVRSPIDGVIAEKRTEIGARLGDGAIAFIVVQTSPLKLRFSVPERFLGRIGKGDQVIARVDPYAGEMFQGTIKTLGGVIDPKTRTMFAEAEFANRDGRLRPGLFARVEVKLD